MQCQYFLLEIMRPAITIFGICIGLYAYQRVVILYQKVPIVYWKQKGEKCAWNHSIPYSDTGPITNSANYLLGCVLDMQEHPICILGMHESNLEKQPMGGSQYIYSWIDSPPLPGVKLDFLETLKRQLFVAFSDVLSEIRWIHCISMWTFSTFLSYFPPH